MTTSPNKESNWCIDHEKGIQMECDHCPPCFKWTKNICKIVQALIEQAIDTK
ncbi:MAG: hypothetical protein ACD_3C00037G0007 [uncultured bacterium (gcode 4)]|uniref:Uncharacterized protein n=1 Tax=uncultured bacterium (gcode 4) TaxID=1234023 RepID=K2FC23_9BACT|nr:MAG: hypothetical protein ACD_3C00037G0007 [uncultured bacterium (gcode 4)]